MRRQGQSGAALIEITTVILIISLIVLVSVPAFGNLRRRSSVRSAAAELSSIFRKAQSRSISRSRSCGVKFTRSVTGEWFYALYDDGNGNGVRNSEITSGVDRLIQPPRRVEGQSRLATIGLPSKAVRDPDGELLQPTSSPVVFNTSTLCSFSPIGGATPGTVYVVDDADDLYAVRVHGGSRVRTLRYDARTSRWAQ